MKEICVLTCICFLFSCTAHQEAERSLSDEQLARIMADINVAEAATIGLSGYPKDSLMKVYYAQVFEIHGCSQDDYENNLRMVSTDLEHLKDIVEQSIQILEAGK